MTATTTVVRIQREDFEIERELAAIRTQVGDAGAIVTFTGLCRSEGGRLAALEIEHYPGMAKIEVTRTVQEAARRWPLLAATVIHRHGRITAGENIVLVVVASSHRRAAFAAAEFLMDWLKSFAPFWKREHHAGGRIGEWVEAKGADALAASSWDCTSGIREDRAAEGSLPVATEELTSRHNKGSRRDHDELGVG